MDLRASCVAVPLSSCVACLCSRRRRPPGRRRTRVAAGSPVHDVPPITHTTSVAVAIPGGRGVDRKDLSYESGQNMGVPICAEKTHIILVSEFVENGSLYKALFDNQIKLFSFAAVETKVQYRTWGGKRTGISPP